MAAIYIIQNIKTGMIYIGSTINPVNRRLDAHKRKLRSGKHGNPILQSSYNKHGLASFEFDVLEDGLSNDVVLLEEAFWIEYFKSIGAELYNIWHPTNTRKGIPVSEEAKRKLSEINTGKKLTQEHKDKIGVANKGNKSNTGKSWSEESRAKRSNINAKSYGGVVSPDGTVYEKIENMNRFCREHGLDARSMRWLVSGKYTQWRGWTKYTPKEEEKKAA